MTKKEKVAKVYPKKVRRGFLGGRPAGRISGTYGIVEYMNGVVGVVRPEQIIFMDTKDFIPKKYR